MTIAAYLAVYAGALIFLIGCLRRILQYARHPVHLRWELYPVPHEEPLRARYGGSYFESAEWWNAPQTSHRGGEWAAMFQEIAFLKSLRQANPRLWLPSFLFHGGLYLAICSVFLASFGTLPSIVIPSAQLAHIPSALIHAAAWAGIAGELSVLAGTLLLLIRRLTDAALRNYTKPADLFNLFFFLFTFAFLAAGSLARPAQSPSLTDVTRGVFTFDSHLRIGSTLGAGLILASALAAYIPFTHMAHFIAKYFTWHSVRWDDRRMEPGSTIERKITPAMCLHPTWSASHFAGDGEMTWAEIAASDPTREAKR